MYSKAAFLIITLFATTLNAKCTVVNGINKCHLNKTGNITINDPGIDNPQKISFVLRDHKMSGDLILYHDHIYDDEHYKDVVKGEFVFHNQSPEKNYVHYQLILKGKKGLIAKTTGNMIVPAGKDQRLRTSNVPLGRKDIAHISSYEIKCVSSNVKLHHY